MPPKTPMSEKIRADMFGASTDLPRIVELDLDKVQPNPDQPRQFFDDAALNELAQSIEVSGLLQPILVQPMEDDRYMIVAGERRYRAHQMLGRTTIAAVVTEGDADEVAIVENIQREDLRPIELAESLGRLIDKHGYTQENAAKIIGKARSTVTELLSLLKLPEAIKAECRTSDIASKSFLVELARMDEAAMQSAWDAFKVQGETSVRSVRQRRGSQPTPLQKAEKALNAAVKAIQEAKKWAPDDIEKLLVVKAILDRAVEGVRVEP